MAASTAKSRWQRVVWDLFHPFKSRVVDEDGLDPVERSGLQDFWHAVKNLWAHTPSKPAKTAAKVQPTVDGK